MTSKQRAYLKGLAMTMDPILQLGKGGLTPENTAAVEEALAARELIKISVLQNCLEDPREMAQVLAERTRSQVVQVIGKKIVLYKESKNHKRIELPKQGNNIGGQHEEDRNSWRDIQSDPSWTSDSWTGSERRVWIG